MLTVLEKKGLSTRDEAPEAVGVSDLNDRRIFVPGNRMKTVTACTVNNYGKWKEIRWIKKL